MRRALVLLVLVAAVLLVAIDRTLAPLTPVRAAGASVYGAVESALGTAARAFGGQDRLVELERENAALRARLLSSGTRSVERLDVPDGRRGVAAHVVGFGRGQSVTIDAGASSGVERDVTVLNADGLVGKVTWAGPATASVSLITDAGSSLGARVAGSGELGVVTGVPGQGLRLSLFDPHAPLEVGDEVVTLGSAGGRPYVAGVPIGTVAALESAPGAAIRTALVRPAARLSALGLVAVIVPRPER
ncbi:rod shape-determining protein MreC [Nonomuraea gerenzanensis]|uniref:Cell shape-determining protein MreC n=1 Tax=Nonomuraea gerenzanensis TaxID=93944 RepID=A0A1M4EIE3_9ACTN|nr:rod shape-determining protein MreC [Nonomuraea gerenzanensis]UBU10088.1 rod shape-determining protein MreC [Nonomuraea gerenzanensis]SBO98458.1 Rod shape-determining protein MreC [Nonomuraea gerenzanensis]